MARRATDVALESFRRPLGRVPRTMSAVPSSSQKRGSAPFRRFGKPRTGSTWCRDRVFFALPSAWYASLAAHPPRPRTNIRSKSRVRRRINLETKVGVRERRRKKPIFTRRRRKSDGERPGWWRARPRWRRSGRDPGWRRRGADPESSLLVYFDFVDKAIVD